MKKEFRAMNVSNMKATDIVKQLNDANIQSTQYRINYFSSQKELVAEKKILTMIKSVIG